MMDTGNATCEASPVAGARSSLAGTGVAVQNSTYMQMKAMHRAPRAVFSSLLQQLLPGPTLLPLLAVVASQRKS